MYGVLPAVCCCGEPGPPPPGSEYYVFEPCGYFDEYCCQTSATGCDGSPAQIVWCRSYATKQGLPLSIPAGACVLIQWNECCVYQLSGIVEDPCPSPPEPAQNIGTIFTTYTSSEERPCCSPEPVDPNETGCLHDALFDPGAPWTPGPCDDLIAFTYDNNDQWGTVAGKEVKVSAEFKFCYESFGIPHFERCDDADPIVVLAASPPKHDQLIGPCIPLDGGVEVNCDNQRTEVFLEYVDCATANPGRPCCGQEDPCENLTPEEYDEYLPDPEKSYSIRTCYRVSNCEDDDGNQLWFEEDVLYLDFPWCHSGIDPDAENVQELVDDYYLDAAVRVEASSITTAWSGSTPIPSTYPTTLLHVCDYTATIMSGNASQIAAGINARIGELVQATSISPWDSYFWFNRRQTCTPCAAFDPVVAPFAEGDELVVDRVDILSSGPRVYLKGRSRKKYICASKTLISAANVACNCTASTCNITTAAISATGNADDGFNLHCISPAEYASGMRYSMRRVSQTGCNVDICIDDTTWLTVQKCATVTGYPADDFCLGLGTTLIKCRNYYHLYQVAICCDTFACELANPIPISCIEDMFQSDKAFCETDGSVIEVL